jgi:hypothetical protein
MKVQDIFFFVILLVLLFKHNPRLNILLGLILLALSVPLFSLWIFFTAERLVWYAAAFFLLSIVLSLIELKG